MARQVGLQGAPFYDVQMKSKIIVTIGLNISQTQILSVSQYPKGHIVHLSGQSNMKEIVMMSIINHDLLVISEYRCEVFNN